MLERLKAATRLAFTKHMAAAQLEDVSVSVGRNSDDVDVVWIDILYSGGSLPLPAGSMQEVIDEVWDVAGADFSPVVSFRQKEAVRVEAAQ